MGREATQFPLLARSEAPLLVRPMFLLVALCVAEALRRHGKALRWRASEPRNEGAKPDSVMDLTEPTGSGAESQQVSIDLRPVIVY